MLREVPFSLESADAGETFMIAPGADDSHDTNADSLDDVFGSAPGSPILRPGDDPIVDNGAPQLRSSDPSDIPRLRSIHVTNGYREGVAASKEMHIQEGFDEGYSLGAELGLKAGWCLGALEGIWHALAASNKMQTSQDPAAQGAVTCSSVARKLEEGEEELQVQKLFGQEYFGPDGVWLYRVPGQDHEEHNVTFENVAAAHPVIEKWTTLVVGIAGSVGMKLQ